VIGRDLMEQPGGQAAAAEQNKASQRQCLSQSRYQTTGRWRNRPVLYAAAPVSPGQMLMIQCLAI
jgi:hypothetical protein